MDLAIKGGLVGLQDFENKDRLGCVIAQCLKICDFSLFFSASERCSLLLSYNDLPDSPM